MAFDPERWLKVADVCCIHIPEVNEEALLRTAVNRAYYAALLSVRSRIDAAQGAGAVPSSGTHEAILQAVRTGGGSFNEVYRELMRLREARNHADYRIEAAWLPRYEVVKYINSSRWIILNRINAMRDEEFRRLKVPRP